MNTIYQQVTTFLEESMSTSSETSESVDVKGKVTNDKSTWSPSTNQNENRVEISGRPSIEKTIFINVTHSLREMGESPVKAILKPSDLAGVFQENYEPVDDEIHISSSHEEGGAHETQPKSNIQKDPYVYTPIKVELIGYRNDHLVTFGANINTECGQCKVHTGSGQNAHCLLKAGRTVENMSTVLFDAGMLPAKNGILKGYTSQTLMDAVQKKIVKSKETVNGKLETSKHETAKIDDPNHPVFLVHEFLRNAKCQKEGTKFVKAKPLKEGGYPLEVKFLSRIEKSLKGKLKDESGLTLDNLEISIFPILPTPSNPPKTSVQSSLSMKMRPSEPVSSDVWGSILKSDSLMIGQQPLMTTSKTTWDNVSKKKNILEIELKITAV